GTQYYGYGSSASYFRVPASCPVTHPLAASIVPRALRTGRCYLRESAESEDLTALAWDEGGAWQFKLAMRRHPDGGWTVSGVLHRREERMDLAAAVLVTQGGLVFTRDRVAALAEGTPFEWVLHLRKAGHIQAPEKDRDEPLAALLCSPGL